jgi:hypothetical protein
MAMDAHTRQAIDAGANLIRWGLSTPDQVMRGLIGYSAPGRDEAMALVEALAASRGVESFRVAATSAADRARVLEVGALLLVLDVSTPETIAANLIDPATPDRDELLHAICALAAVRKARRP